MRRLLTLFVVMSLISISAISQENEESEVWAVHRLTPKSMPTSKLVKRISDHDKKYHDDKSIILSIATGDDTGDIIWAYGPMSYTEMDNMKLAEGHEEDNMELSENYVEEYHSMTLWKYQDDLSVNYGDEMENYATRSHNSIKLKPGMWDSWKEMANRHIEVYKKHKLSEVFVYTAVFGTKDGYNLLLISPFENFASFDVDNNYKEKFEAVHGEGSLKETSDKMQQATEDSYSFMTVVNKKP